MRYTIYFIRPLLNSQNTKHHVSFIDTPQNTTPLFIRNTAHQYQKSPMRFGNVNQTYITYK